MTRLLLTALGTLLLDQASKLGVIHLLSLRERGEIDVIDPLLNFRWAENRGMNFGLLSNDAVLEDAVLGAGGFADALGEGGLHISMSTVSPTTSRKLAAEHARRGSHVSFEHPEGYAVIQALIARGVIGDYREPRIMRFGFTPLYSSFTEVWDAVEILGEILDNATWDQPQFKVRNSVT